MCQKMGFGNYILSWRTHKCRLMKKYFKLNMTEDANIKNGPPNVPLE